MNLEAVRIKAFPEVGYAEVSAWVFVFGNVVAEVVVGLNSAAEDAVVTVCVAAGVQAVEVPVDVDYEFVVAVVVLVDDVVVAVVASYDAAVEKIGMIDEDHLVAAVVAVVTDNGVVEQMFEPIEAVETGTDDAGVAVSQIGRCPFPFPSAVWSLPYFGSFHFVLASHCLLNLGNH